MAIQYVRSVVMNRYSVTGEWQCDMVFGSRSINRNPHNYVLHDASNRRLAARLARFIYFLFCAFHTRLQSIRWNDGFSNALKIEKCAMPEPDFDPNETISFFPLLLLAAR